VASKRLQRKIDRLLIEAEEAIPQLNWISVRDSARAVLAIDPENSKGLAFLAPAPQLLNTSDALPTTGPPAAATLPLHNQSNPPFSLWPLRD